MIEEILAKKDVGRPVKKLQKQNELIAFQPPGFLAQFSCQLLDAVLDLDENNLVFALYSFGIEGRGYSLIVESINNTPNKFFFSETPIIVINKFDAYLIGGSRDGAIVLWDLRSPESFYKSEKATLLSKGLIEKLPTNEITFRTPSYSSLQELLSNAASFAHKAAISKILVSPENALNKEIITLDILNQLIIWKVIELNSSEIERNWVSFASRSKVKLVQSLQINLSDIFSESLKEQHRILNISNVELDTKENLLYFCSNSMIVKSDKYGSISSSPPNVYSLKDCFEEACPVSIFLTNIDIFYVGYSDGGIGYWPPLA